jgi:hypothetical protein
MAITRADLNANGFKHSGSPTLSVNDGNRAYWRGLWHRSVDVPGSDASYLVCVEGWDLGELNLPVAVSFSACAEFGEAGEDRFKVSMHTNKEHTVADVLSFFKRVCANMGCYASRRMAV